MFYRSVDGWEQWKIIFHKNLKVLMLPYVVFSILGILVGVIYYHVTDDSTYQPTISTIVTNFVGMGCYYWSSHLWFLLTLFLVKIIAPLMLRFLNIYILILVFIAIAFAHNYFMQGSFNWIGNFCTGMFFYLMGIMLKDKQYNPRTIVLSVLLLLIIGLVKPTLVPMFSNLVQNDGIYLLWFPFCLSGIILINNVFRKVSSYHISFPILESVGKNSMLYYLLHFSIPILLCKLHLFYQPDGNHWEYLCYLLVFTAICLPIISKIILNTRLNVLLGK